MRGAKGSGPGGGPPLYGIDTMLFVYHFEGNEEFGEAAGRLLKAAEEGRCRLVASVLSLMEVLVVPKRRRMDDLCRRYRELFESFPNLAVLPVSSEIAELAAGLRAAHPLRTPDALHLATALHAGAQAFVSEDRRLPGIAGLEVRSLDDVAPASISRPEQQ
ncbi:MAG TPA: type II toxin-antitoxin system VapC family toxin [Thermoanaerobaculia bacterium]|nr:type II toxin-antitoxin system VapC family toxin [Thermoanaerobaculia bacterium]